MLIIMYIIDKTTHNNPYHIFIQNRNVIPNAINLHDIQLYSYYEYINDNININRNYASI